MIYPQKQSQHSLRETLLGVTLIRSKARLIEPRITKTSGLPPAPHTEAHAHKHTSSHSLLGSKSG